MIARWKAELFNAGCDARLRGEPESSCPYPLTSKEAVYWLQGHQHVSRQWARLVRGRWAYRALPELVGA